MSDVRGKWRWRVVTVAMVAFVIACAWLAAWQYRRAQEHAALNAAVTEARRASPLALNPAEVASLPRHAHVYAVGRYRGGRQALLTELTKPHGDRVGAEVLTPLALPSGELLLVNRGWVPADADGRVHADLSAPRGTLRVTGFLAPLPRPGLDLGGNPTRVKRWPARLLFPDWAELERLYGGNLVHRQLLLAPDVAHGFARDWNMRPAHGPARNYSYMVQWSVFALIALGLWLWFFHRRRQARP